MPDASATTIGLLSDSHGRAAITARAVALLVDHGAQLLLHLGDVETASVIDALVVEPPVASRLVFGNCDYDAAALARYAEDLGIGVDDPAGRIDTPRGPLVYCHGHVARPMREAVAGGAAYLCHGHTHVAADDRDGATRVINPGALFRASEHTVALLDARDDRLTFHRIC